MANILISIIAIIVSIIMIVKFFQIAKDVAKIGNYVSGFNTLNQCIDAAELEIVKGNKEKALEYIKLADYLNNAPNFGKEIVTADRFNEIKKLANQL